MEQNNPGPSQPVNVEQNNTIEYTPNRFQMFEEEDSLGPKSFNHSWLRNRELSMKRKLGDENDLKKTLYSVLQPVGRWEDTEKTGGIFNLEFSEDGSILAAACERKSVLLYDPLSRNVVGGILNAHTDCVNFIKFLDCRMFATCSDDTTIALWDARNLKSNIRTLRGHSNWVKNIEFSHKDKLLVTAGFDGSIYTWDINNYTENGFIYNRIFQTNGLMRMKMSDDGSRMVICTTSGYLIVIHDLDLSTITEDLNGFKPNMYRLMQLSETSLPFTSDYHDFFNKKRSKNRVEFITDFPKDDEAEIVSSLQIHPHGWCALSRNITNEGTSNASEWTCVHDIQDYSDEEEEPCQQSRDESNPNSQNGPGSSSRSGEHRSSGTGISFPQYNISNNTTENRRVSMGTHDIWEVIRVMGDTRSSQDRSYRFNDPAGLQTIIRSSSGLGLRDSDSDSSDVDRTDILLPPFRNTNEVSNRSRNIGNDESSDTSTDSSNNLPSFLLDHIRRRRRRRRSSAEIGNPRRGALSTVPMTTRGAYRVNVNTHSRNKRTYVLNRPRLTHYIKELNVGHGYIKELCFSPDGRFICSPYNNGIRLLAFNSDCAEMSTCVPSKGQPVPTELFEVTSCKRHIDYVLSCKFSPKHNLLASGCLNGRVVLYQPLF